MFVLCEILLEHGFDASASLDLIFFGRHGRAVHALGDLAAHRGSTLLEPNRAYRLFVLCEILLEHRFDASASLDLIFFGRRGRAVHALGDLAAHRGANLLESNLSDTVYLLIGFRKSTSSQNLERDNLISNIKQ